RLVFQHALENRQRLSHAFLRLSIVVVTVSQRLSEKNTRLRIVRSCLYELAQDLDFFGVTIIVFFLALLFFVGFGSRAGLDVQALRLAGMAFQAHSLGEGFVGEVSRGTAAKGEAKVEGPITHGTLGIDAHALFRGAN